MNTTFNTLLHRVLQEKDINLTNFYNFLNDLGLNITYSSLYAYYSGTSVPNYTVAKNILKLSKFNISNEELEKILDYSKQINKDEKIDNNNELHINLKIKPKNINNNYINNAKALKTIIEMRSDEIFGDDNEVSLVSAGNRRKISKYISYLIKKDLEESGFIKLEENKQ